jgi:phenylacetate-CoA ligase
MDLQASIVGRGEPSGYDELPRSELDAARVEALSALVGDLPGRSPFYRERLGEGTQPDAVPLQDLPITSRDDVARAQADEPPWGGLLAVPVGSLSIMGFTGAISAGLPGRPSLQLAATSGDMMTRVATASRALSMGGSGPGDRTAIVGEVARSLLHHVLLGALAGLGSTPFQTGRGLTLRHVRHTLPAMAPTQVVTHPTYAMHLARLLEEEGTSLPVERLFLWGETGPSVPSVRRSLEEAWGGVQVRDLYATEELGVLAAECEAGNGLHGFEDVFAYEVVDPATDRVLGPGERGELLVTPLRSEAMPLLRYRTGDLVITDDGPCACCRTHLRLHVLGKVVRGTDGTARVIEQAKVENLLGRLRSLWGLYRIVLDGEDIRLEVPLAALDEERQAVAINTALLAARTIGAELTPVRELPTFYHRAIRVVERGDLPWWEVVAEEQRRLEE